MSHSSTNLVFELELSSYVLGTTGYKNELYLSPRQLDVKVKTCTLPIGAELAVFPQEQTVSGGVKLESCPSKRGAACHCLFPRAGRSGPESLCFSAVSDGAWFLFLFIAEGSLVQCSPFLLRKVQMVLLSSSQAFSGPQERGPHLGAVIWYLPELIAKLIFLTQEQTSCEGILDGALPLFKKAQMNRACPTTGSWCAGGVLTPSAKQPVSLGNSAYPQVHVVHVLLCCSILRKSSRGKVALLQFFSRTRCGPLCLS